MSSRIASVLVLGLLASAGGCGDHPSGGYGEYGAGEIRFKDDVSSNTSVEPGKLELTFTDLEGNTVSVMDYRGKKHVVLVFMRGSTEGICPFCSAQTTRLMSNHQAFLDRGAVVLVVYPGPKGRADEFVRHVASEAGGVRPPFPVLLDVGARVVASLGIEKDLARPSTYILDREGRVRFAYVGATRTDRPSIAAMLRELDALNADSHSGSNP